MPAPVKINFTMRPQWRTPEGLLRVREIAARLGVRITGEGKASVSGAVEPEVFEKLFGSTPQPVPPSRQVGQDFGSPGGYTAPPVEVPAELSDYVELISVTPPHLRL